MIMGKFVTYCGIVYVQAAQIDASVFSRRASDAGLTFAAEGTHRSGNRFMPSRLTTSSKITVKRSLRQPLLSASA